MVDYPIGWEQKSLKNIVDRISDGDWIEKEHIKSFGEYRIIQTGNIGIGEYLENEEHKKYMTNESYLSLNGNRIYPGDILISRLAAPAGRCTILTNVYSKMVTSVDVAIIRPNTQEFDSYFLMNLLNSKEILNKIEVKVSGTTHQRISRKNLEKIELCIPSLPEQKAIAKTLMSFDKHIENLSKLIKKKKMIRDGAVEELLTGEKRTMSEYTWKEVCFEDICIPRGMVRGPFGGSLKKECFVANGYKVYEQRNAIYKSINIGHYYIDELKYKELERFSINKDDFIISCSGTIGKIYRIPSLFKKGIINQALLKVTIDPDKCSLDFFNYYFNWNKFQEKIIDDTQGGAMKNLVGMDKFKKTYLFIPSDINEQQAIADILISIDKEIENLEQVKEKFMNLKAGAIDDLLTGRVRLV